MTPRDAMRGRPLLILGAGGHAKVVADAALAAGWRVGGFLDDRAETAPLPGYELLGKLADLPALLARHDGASLVWAIGDNETRRRLAGQYALDDGIYAAVIHPASVVSPFAGLGPGTVVMAGAIVNPGAVIGRHAILNTGCTVDHDCRIGDFAHISPGAHLAGRVTVMTGAQIGTGAAVIPDRTIGEWSLVGAGAAVTEDVPPRVVAAGVPARRLRDLVAPENRDE